MNSRSSKITSPRQAQSRIGIPTQADKTKVNSWFAGKKFVLGIFVIAFFLLLTGLSIYSYQKYQTGFALEFSQNTITVKQGGDFQAALDRANPGDTIFLEPGVTYKGAFTLPNKDGNQFITIRSSAPDAQLPPAETRIDPQKYASVLPKLESNIKGKPVISAVDGAHHYRFVGIEFAPTIEGISNIIKLGTGEEKSVDELPHHIEFDRVWIHGSKKDGQRRGIAANGRNIVIQNSYFSDIMRRGEESQAIAVWATDGPVEIINNYLEGAAENILFGGAKSVLGLIPSDIIVRDNHLNKPLEWRDTDWVVKNLFEIKNGRRIKVENNLMTNNWGMGQDGTAILFTTKIDSGPDAIIEDIEFTNNIVRNVGGGISISGGQGRGGHRLKIYNNFFLGIDAEEWNSDGHFMKSTDWNGLLIENNTIIQSGSISKAYGKPIKDFVFRNNIIFENKYGIKGDGSRSGQETIDKYFPNGTFTCNIIIGGKSTIYREKNLFLDSIDQVGFEDFKNGDYRLRDDSKYLKSGCDGKRIGAELGSKLVGEE